MAEPDNKLNNAQRDDEFDRFDEAQPFLQLLADMLNRMSGELEADYAEQEISEAAQPAE